MKKSTPQILPSFENIQLVTKDINYNQIYESEKATKTAWLIVEDDLLWEFVEDLGEEDNNSNFYELLNLYDFYVAYNVKFPMNLTSVMLASKSQFFQVDLKDFYELLNAVMKAPFDKQYYIFIKNNTNSANELSKLKLQIIQQFIYLRMYLPVIIADSFDEAKIIFENILNSSETNSMRNIGIFGTKKAGKSTLINALINDDYAIISRKLPTPNKIIYLEATDSDIISLKYENTNAHFSGIKFLQKYLIQKFEEADNNYKSLEEMQIFIPNFPEYLRNCRLIDTPASNFALNSEYINIIKNVISEINCVIFVMNYSTHLTDDEIRLFDEVYKKFNEKQSKLPILITINQIDEIYASEEVKSYERLEDYIQKRLVSLGYDNFLVLGISALQAVYCRQLDQLLMVGTFGEKCRDCIQKSLNNSPSLSEKLQRLKDRYRKTEKLTAISFVNNIILDFKDFHGIKINDINKLQETHRIEYLKHLIQYLA